ncbi:MAG: hypothetical protein JWS10_4184 [Cypionkella sp.]|uniref:glycosyltransferase n=1 Tax=Cypionkella sp. TaxID=2811411 RepID=UPI00260F68ED|nr:glycosyltransferase [Cypionkella sp.]MDB5661569.1 hypothetical protein [Cypionkella sp.]
MTAVTIPHVLMTRFNLATPGREASIRNKPDWLTSRFDLFEQFCLPSVGAQTSRAFTWIVYFDKDTPETFKTRVRELQKQVAFEAYYTGLFPASGWPQSLREVLGVLPPVVLTSRLDNDDALANDYMERTLQAAQGRKPDPRIGIVITNGFIRSTSRAYTISHSCNAFTSWLERTENPNTLMTAMGIAHMDAEASGPLVQVPGEGGWLQVVHGGNVSNKVRGQRIAPDRLATRFHPGALARLEAASPGQIALENSILTPLRDGRDRLMGLARRVRGTVR